MRQKQSNTTEKNEMRPLKKEKHVLRAKMRVEEMKEVIHRQSCHPLNTKREKIKEMKEQATARLADRPDFGALVDQPKR
jgi:hypothetical protein